MGYPWLEGRCENRSARLLRQISSLDLGIPSASCSYPQYGGRYRPWRFKPDAAECLSQNPMVVHRTDSDAIVERRYGWALPAEHLAFLFEISAAGNVWSDLMSGSHLQLCR